MNKRCTNSSCRKTFSTLIYGGKCPFCGKVYPQIRQGWKNGAAVDVELIDMGPKKIRVIKLVREGTGLGLRETKELVESAPVLIRTSIPINEAKALKRKLEDTGASVTLIRGKKGRRNNKRTFLRSDHKG